MLIALAGFAILKVALMFDNLFQTGNPSAGGWRYDYRDRPSSVDALYKPQGIDPDFLKKVAGLMPDDKKGLLDQAVQAQPLSGLLEAPGGNDQAPENGGTSGKTGIGIGSMSNARDMAAMQAAGMGFAKGGLGIVGAGKGLLDAANVVNTTNSDVLGHVNSMPDPIAALNAMQGWTTIDQDYLEKMRSEGGLLGGYGRDGSAGTNGVDGYGGFGGTDTSGGYGNNGGW